MIRGITEVNLPSYATLHQATVSFQDMGDRTITSQVRIDGNIVPSFVGTDGKDWTLSFRGQKFIMPIRKPQASKGDRVASVVDLTFQHWAIYEMKRYYFVQMAVTEAGTAVADKYEASLAVTLPEFVDALNQVLNYWTGGKIVADLYDTAYDITKSYVDINYSHIWEVVQKIYEVFSVRWYLDYNAQTDVYTIKINYPASELTHEFEYGFEGGLLKFERNVQSTDITNLLLGRGGDRNLPAYYFKQAPLGSLFASDPDACPELANVYFENLRGKTFRDYIKGWNYAHHGGDPMPNPTWAYTKGATDEVFNPVEFVKNEDSIEQYGELWGAIENKEDIYPSIQGVEVSPYGRIDEVVAVEEVTTDDIESAADASAVVTNLDGTKSLSKSIPTGESTHTIKGGSFTVPTGLTGRLSWSWFKEFTGDSYNPAANVYVDTNPSHSYIKVYNSNGQEVSSQAIPAGTGYYWEITVRMVNNNDNAMFGSFGAQELKLTTSNTDSAAWKPTFDIWVKNIWNTTKQTGETDDDYVERVWLPILGDRAGNEAAVVFSDGWLAQSTDWEFVILGNIFAGIHYDTSKTYNGVRSEWRITLQKTDAELEATGLYIPNARTNGNAVAGNHFFFIGIDMPYQYVTWAEEKLDNFKNGQLDDSADINPTWAVTLDKVRIEQDDSEGAQTYKIIDRLDTGALVNIKDKRFTYNHATGVVDTLQLYLQTVNITWQEGKIISDVEVVLSDTVAAVLSPMEKLEGEVSVLKANAVEMNNIEAIINKIANVSFLKKTGETQKSYSPTSFASLIQSTDFRQGDIGGRGWGLYRSNALPDSDEHSDYAGDESEHPSETHKRAILEVDELTVRHTMRVNQLVVNQISYEGGKQIISAAGMECSEAYADRIVVSGAYKNVYICHFNQKRGSVANLFQVGDIALGQVFSASNVEVKYYRRRVVACGEDYIALSNESGEFTGEGVPAAGDVIVQYGSYTNPERRYAIIRDVIGGGYERMISGLSDVNSAGVEYYFAGQQTGTGMRWFIGDDGQYARWTPNGGLEIAGKITVKAGSVGLTEFEEYETLQTTIDALEDNMIDVKQALFNINADTVLDDSEKSHLRTIWEQMNGLDSLTEVGAGGSYLSTVALLEELQYQGETVTLSFHGQEILFNGNVIEFHYIGVADFTMAFYNVREYLTRMKLYEGGPVPNFERAYLAELLTKYNKLQEDLLAKAQKRYADVTAGAQIEEFIEGEYAQDIADIYEQMDKKAETWVQDTDPAAEWTTATMKHEHIGDLWWNTNNVEVSGVGAGASAVYRYNNTTRVYEWKETTVPQEIFDKIDGKSSIYIAKPTKYKERDLWLIGSDTPTADIPTGCTIGDLAVAIRDGNSYNKADWEKRVKYTDDTALHNFIESTFIPAMEDIQEQVDRKAETYIQGTDPAADWDTIALREQHLWDIWWNNSDETVSGVNAGESAIYKKSGSTFYWEVAPVPKEIFDEIDGKNSLYVTRPDEYKARDMWIIETDCPAQYIPVGCTVGDLVVAVSDSTEFVVTHWHKKVKYTDDTAAERLGVELENLRDAVENMNRDDIFDPSEKMSVRTLWESINGQASLDIIGTTGSYQNAIDIAEKCGFRTGNKEALTFAGQTIEFNSNEVIFSVIGRADLYVAYLNLREYLKEVELYENVATAGFDRLWMSALFAKYYNVEALFIDRAERFFTTNTLDNFITGEYAEDIRTIMTQVDKKAETFAQDTDPSIGWSDEQKTEHEGDIWWNTSASKIGNISAGNCGVYRNKQWVETNVPKEVFDEIDGKAALYVIKPTSYHERDMWIIESGATNLPAGCTVGDLVVAIQDSNSYNPLHWTKKVKYTDDTALQNFINNEYADDIDELQGQIDKKAETWAQATDPAAGWSAAEKAEHINDIWWNKSTSTISGVKAGECAIYKLISGTYQWVVTPVPEEVFDEIDGKAALYIAKPVNGYSERDMWIIEQGATNLPAGATIGDLVVSIRNNTQYIAGDWQKKVKYTDDTYAQGLHAQILALQEAISRINTDNILDVAEKKQIRTLWENINGKASLTVIGADGSYQNALNIAADKGYTDGEQVILKFNGTEVVYNTQSLMFYDYGAANLYSALITLRAYLTSVELYEDSALGSFDRPWMAYLFTKYYNAEAQFISNADKSYTDDAIEEVIGEISEFDYLKAALGSGASTEMGAGIALLNVIGVRSDSPNSTPAIVAGMNGSGNIGALNDAAKGKLMIWAGANNLADAKNAPFRVWESGLVEANSGIIGGFEIREDGLFYSEGGQNVVYLGRNASKLRNAQIEGSIQTRCTGSGVSNYLSLAQANGQPLIRINSAWLSTNAYATYLYLASGTTIVNTSAGGWWSKLTVDAYYDLLDQVSPSADGGTFEIPSFNLSWDFAGVIESFTVEILLLRWSEGSYTVLDTVYRRTNIGSGNNTVSVPTFTRDNIDNYYGYSVVIHITGKVQSSLGDNSRVKVTVDKSVYGKITYGSSTLTKGIFIGANGLDFAMGEYQKFQYITRAGYFSGGNILTDVRGDGGQFEVSFKTSGNDSVGMRIQGYYDASGSYNTNNTSIHMNLGDGNGWRKVVLSGNYLCLQ